MDLVVLQFRQHNPTTLFPMVSKKNLRQARALAVHFCILFSFSSQSARFSFSLFSNSWRRGFPIHILPTCFPIPDGFTFTAGVLTWPEEIRLLVLMYQFLLLALLFWFRFLFLLAGYYIKLEKPFVILNRLVTRCLPIKNPTLLPWNSLNHSNWKCYHLCLYLYYSVFFLWFWPTMLGVPRALYTPPVTPWDSIYSIFVWSHSRRDLVTYSFSSAVW